MSAPLAPRDVDPAAVLDSTQFRDAMARLGSAVNIVTTNGPHGWAGFAASAVCSVTDMPPTLLVCVQRTSSAYAALHGNRVLCVNTLASSHEALSQLFGGKTPMSQRFAAAEWTALATGAPVLRDARVAFDCRIDRVAEVGTHDVLFCTVVAIASNGGADEGLYYVERRYRRLAEAQI